MSTFLLKNPDCVFVHIPKAVGSSIGKDVRTKASARAWGEDAAFIGTELPRRPRPG